MERLRGEGVVSAAAMAQALTERGVLTPRGRRIWTHTTVAGSPTGTPSSHGETALFQLAILAAPAIETKTRWATIP
jgi:hypothetical protein